MSNVLTIPAGEDFLRLLARGVLGKDKKLAAAAAPAPAPAKAQLSATRILLPTSRACRLFSEILLEESAADALLLPKILPLGDIETDDESAWLAEMIQTPAVINNVRRHIELCALVRENPAIKNMDGNQPLAKNDASQSSIAADMAYALARFIDLTDRYEIDRAQLKTLAPDRFAEHWQVTLNLLNVIIENWPDFLAQHRLEDPIARRNILLRHFAHHLQKNPPQAPVIIAGSTGSWPATSFLLKTTANLKQGAIILPGLDLDMDDNDWNHIDATHPQYHLKKLLADIHVRRDQVESWDQGKTSKARQWLARETLRPAETTDHWPQSIAAQSDFLGQALDGITLIEAENLREEAGIIALMLRESLEKKNQTAALITHDRSLARRVIAMLKIWDIDIDDAAGAKLTSLPAFIFLKLIVEAVISDFSPVAFLNCFKHPLAMAEQEEGAFRQKIRQIERNALRGPAPKGLQGIQQNLQNNDPNHDLIAIIKKLEKIFAPLIKLAQNNSASFIDFLKAHIACAEALAASSTGDGATRLWQHEAGQPIADHIRDLIKYGGALQKISITTYLLLFESLFATAPPLRRRASLGSRLHIWSPLEARLQFPDLAILGALNEGVWPAHIEADPWLNRAMRSTLGLPPLEEQTGQAAHDFQQHLAAPQLVLTRAIKGEDGSPQQTSRWLLRLKNIVEGAGHQLNRPKKWADILRTLYQGEKSSLCEPPAPKPPADVKPKTLSASALTDLIGNPYAFYARRILKLKPLDPLEEEPTPAQRGLIIHDILKDFAKQNQNNLPADAIKKISSIAKKHFGAASGQIVRAFWMPRFEDMAHQFIDLEKNNLRQNEIKIFAEIDGKMSLDIGGERIILTARADRIDLYANGLCAIYDYKTGNVPTIKSVVSMNEPQLPLEALIAQCGGFASIGQTQPVRLAFIGLKEESWTKMLVEIPDVKTRLDDADEYIQKILADYLNHNKTFSPPENKKSDYDHLARIKAWHSGEEEQK